MASALTANAKSLLLIFGAVELLGASLWCFAGAGIYGSPLAIMGDSERLRIGMFLLAGPVSAFGAALLALKRPSWSAAWMLGGGLASGGLAMPLLSSDAGVWPWLLVSAPMLAAGVALLRFLLGAAPRLEVPDQGPKAPLPSGSNLAIRLGAFLVCAIGGFILIAVAAINDVIGLSGGPSGANPLIPENADLADGVVVGAAAAVALIVTLLSRRLRLPWEAAAGLWAAAALAGLIIILR